MVCSVCGREQWGDGVTCDECVTAAHVKEHGCPDLCANCPVGPDTQRPDGTFVDDYTCGHQHAPTLNFQAMTYFDINHEGWNEPPPWCPMRLNKAAQALNAR